MKYFRAGALVALQRRRGVHELGELVRIHHVVATRSERSRNGNREPVDDRLNPQRRFFDTTELHFEHSEREHKLEVVRNWLPAIVTPASRSFKERRQSNVIGIT